MNRRVFHALPAAVWARHLARGGGPWAPPSLGAEGFVHLSAAEQLADSLALHLSGAGALVVLELDPLRLGTRLAWERSRGGLDFPHLYRAVERADVLRGWRLAGARDSPALGDRPCADTPGGEPAPALWPA